MIIGPMLHLLRSGIGQVFGRRQCWTSHTLMRPASEKRQGTKSRWVGTRRYSRLYGDLDAQA
jgi:hypothetical protein